MRASLSGKVGMGDGVKLPVVSTATLTLQWALIVARRHWQLVLAYALVPFVFILAFEHYFPLRIGRSFHPRSLLVLFAAVPIYSVALVGLALVTHNEVLRGTAGLDAATLGRSGSRVLGYILDGALVMVGVPASLMGVMAVLGKLVGLGSHPPSAAGLIVLPFIALWVLAVLAIQRLLLRLPSRAVGQTLPWREVWRLGRGNSWRMLGSVVLVSAVVGIGVGAIMMPLQMAVLPQLLPVPPLAGGVPPSLPPFPGPDTPFLIAAGIALIMGLGYPVNTILLCTFLSLAYVHLRDGEPGGVTRPGA